MRETYLPLQILSRYHLKEKIESGLKVYSHCISILDPGEELGIDFNSVFKKTLKLYFHDINSRDDLPRDNYLEELQPMEE
jgi:predicted protein tyrosine phosphatase